MESDEAIRTVAAELRTADAPLSVFQPEDVKAEFFLGEAAIAAAAGIFLTAFVKGVKAELENRGEELGKTVTKWFIDRLEGVFRKSSKGKEFSASKASLRKAVNAARTTSKVNKKALDSALNKYEKRFSSILEEQGLDREKAEKIARTLRKTTATLIVEK